MSVLVFKAKVVPLLFRNYKVGNFIIEGLLEEGKNHENKLQPVEYNWEPQPENSV